MKKGERQNALESPSGRRQHNIAKTLTGNGANLPERMGNLWDCQDLQHLQGKKREMYTALTDNSPCCLGLPKLLIQRESGAGCDCCNIAIICSLCKTASGASQVLKVLL
ncbi:tumor necrosis factor alpha-induced protein 2 [Platysternon megacephalum]|uniref:Tumor necrosis factor alpha-induced protein 2 n=1 Tax=Platysternon megacephalum TaxID=55544 RepID=A0A4D9EX00_9SAUR|nr:tumor necrosis factor alpha-induced protein 2 [Platysternon megacephalum]